MPTKHYTDAEVNDLLAATLLDQQRTNAKLREQVDFNIDEERKLDAQLDDPGYPPAMTRDQWRNAFVNGDPDIIDARTGRPMGRRVENGVLLRADQRVSDHIASTDAERKLSLGAMLRGYVTGDWKGHEAEQRAMSTTGASAIVPTAQAAYLIDKARNRARVIEAGARTVKMDARDVKVPRLTGASAPAWRNEAAAIAAGDLTLDYVSLSAKSLAFRVTVSRELVSDSSPEAMGLIVDDLAKQVALEWDRVALLGSGSAPEPKGLFNQAGVQVVTAGTGNGETMANLKYDFLLSDQALARAANYEPNAYIYAPRTDAALSALKDTTGQYIRPPVALGAMRALSTNQVPINQTVGTSSDCSAVFMGEYGQLLLGVREGPMTFQLAELSAATGQLDLIIWFRGDIAVAQPLAFVVHKGVRG
jgi:HK97 family phage major capsid protein